MTIEWLRDLIIIIYGVVGIVFLVIVVFMAFALFKRVKTILNSLTVTSANIEEISTVARDQIVRPLVQVGSIMQGISRWIEIISSYFKKHKKEVKDGQQE